MTFSPRLSQIRDILECVLCIVAMIIILIIGVVKITHDNESYATGYYEGFAEAVEMYEHPVEIGYPME